MALYTLDTSAVLAFVRGEPGEDEVESILLRAKGETSEQLLLPFLALMEVEYILLREMPRDDVERNLVTISAWPVEVVESSEAWRRTAALIKARGGLSLADAWVASLALLHDAQLIHKDPVFDGVAGLKALRLPYDRDASRRRV